MQFFVFHNDAAGVFYLCVATRTRGTGGVDSELAGGGDAARVVTELLGATVTLLVSVHHTVAAAGNRIHPDRDIAEALVGYGIQIPFDHPLAAGTPRNVGLIFITEGERSRTCNFVGGKVWNTVSWLCDVVCLGGGNKVLLHQSW